MSNLTRRSLLKRSAFSAAAVSIPWTAKSWGQVVGANEDIRIAVLGLNGRGKNHTDAYRGIKGVRLVALCDADEAVLQKEQKRLTSGGKSKSAKPTTKPTTRASEAEGDAAAADKAETTDKPLKLDLYTDLRKLLENKDIDAISIATPNHWHSLAAIWGLAAGKDVYVEKPVSHNVWEGRRLVEASRHYNKICQAGTHSRSSAAIR